MYRTDNHTHNYFSSNVFMPVRFQLSTLLHGKHLGESGNVTVSLFSRADSECLGTELCVCVCVPPSPLTPRLWHTEFITPLFASYSARMGIAVVARPLGQRNCVKLHNNSGIENMFFSPVLSSGFCSGIGLSLSL